LNKSRIGCPKKSLYGKQNKCLLKKNTNGSIAVEEMKGIMSSAQEHKGCARLRTAGQRASMDDPNYLKKRKKNKASKLNDDNDF
jgi:hypothetical protein